MINSANKRIWVKFHLKTQQGIKNLTDQEAEAIIAKDRESHQRDLFDSIEKCDFPKWNMKIQVMSEEDAAKDPYNPFDLTKVWNHRDDDDDYYSQPGALFRMMTAAQQKALLENTARAMGDAPKEIKIRHISHCMKADPSYGKGSANALGIAMSAIPK